MPAEVSPTEDVEAPEASPAPSHLESAQPTTAAVHEENEEVPGSPKSNRSDVDDSATTATTKSNRRDDDKLSTTDSPQLRRNRKKSESDSIAGPEEHQKSILKSGNRVRPTFDKHLSFDAGDGTKNDQDAIDKYYDRNHHTITGVFPDKHQETIRSLRFRRSSVAGVSRVSTRSGKSTGMHARVPTTRKFTKSFYWLAHHHKKFGFRHLIMLLFIAFYTLIGATIFALIEIPAERELGAQSKKVLDETAKQVAKEMIHDMTVNNGTLDVEYVQAAVLDIYVRMMEAEGTYRWSTLYKYRTGDWKWTFSSSIFYTQTLLTAVGYGSIAVQTVLGQVVTVVYGMITVPLTTVVIRDLGQLFLVSATRVYGIIIIKLRAAKGIYEQDGDELIKLPIKFCIMSYFGAWLFIAFVVYEYDSMLGPPGTGLDYWSCLYWCYITITTIGFGELLPNNVTLSPLIMTVAFFGMPIVRVVNRCTYIAFENGIFGALTVLENRMFADLEETTPSVAGDVASKKDELSDEESDEETERIPNEWLNNFTVRSIATFMKSDADVYAGAFGKVNMRRGDIVKSNQNSIHKGSDFQGSRCNNDDTVTSRQLPRWFRDALHKNSTAADDAKSVKSERSVRSEKSIKSSKSDDPDKNVNQKY